MTRVWSNASNGNDHRNGNHDTWSETNVDEKNGRISTVHDKVNGKNGFKKDYQVDEDVDKEEGETEKKSFFRLCFSETLEKDLAEQSKVVLKMIYFFQVLPFYILQFTSGMALGFYIHCLTIQSVNCCMSRLSQYSCATVDSNKQHIHTNGQ